MSLQVDIASASSTIQTQSRPIPVRSTPIVESVEDKIRSIFPNDEQMLAIAQCESGMNPKARNLTRREDSRGIFQINVFAHPEYDPERLYEIDYNLTAAFAVWQKEGLGAWKQCLNKQLKK